jgi:protein with PEP-CTERM/exosortase system signal
MRTLILAAIRCSLMFTAVAASLFSVRPAQAYTVTLKQVGSNVVANGSGAIDLTGLLLFSGGGECCSGILPVEATILTGPVSVVQIDNYETFSFTGPSSFGSGFFTFASSGSGDEVAIFATDLFIELFMPQGYVSGTALSSTSTWNNATFASLGATPGAYVWTWGTGLANQIFTLQTGPAVVPDGGSTVSLLGCALLGLAALRRKLGC